MASKSILETRLDQMREQANKGCGLIFELYAAQFSGMIDHEFPPDHPQRQEVLHLCEGEYFTPKQLEQQRQDNTDEGYCKHSLDPNCCPLGCGDMN